MHELSNLPEPNESLTDQDNYVPPQITFLEITLEKGFATSSASGTEDWGSLTW